VDCLPSAYSLYYSYGTLTLALGAAINTIVTTVFWVLQSTNYELPASTKCFRIMLCDFLMTLYTPYSSSHSAFASEAVILPPAPTFTQLILSFSLWSMTVLMTESSTKKNSFDLMLPVSVSTIHCQAVECTEKLKYIMLYSMLYLTLITPMAEIRHWVQGQLPVSTALKSRYEVYKAPKTTFHIFLKTLTFHLYPI